VVSQAKLEALVSGQRRGTGGAMSELPSIDPSAEAQLDQAYQRLLWTGAAANGALLLALIGFAGSAEDPLAALRAITIPAICGLTGFVFGGTAISYAVAQLAQRPLEAIARAKIAMAHRHAEAFKDVLTTPAMDPALALLVWGDQADHQIRDLIASRLRTAQDQTEKSPALFDEAIHALRTSYANGIAHMRKARRWLAASFVAATLGVLLLVGHAWTQPVLPNSSRSAVPVATIADSAVLSNATAPAVPLDPLVRPPCPGGAHDCQPWERGWKEPPPVGTVVAGGTEPADR